MICVIVGDRIDRSTRVIVELGKEQNIKVDVVRWRDIVIHGSKVTANGFDICSFDRIIPRSPVFPIHNYKKFADFSDIMDIVYVATQEKDIFMPNRDYFQNQLRHTKLSQSFQLSRAGIKTIETKTHPFSDVQQVVKVITGGNGYGVSRFSSKAAIKKSQKNIQGPLIFQPYQQHLSDFRAVVIEGNCIGVRERVKQGSEWRANTSQGAKGRQPDSVVAYRVKNIAEQAASALSLNFCGVDVMDINEVCHVIEINALPAFGVFENYVGNNIITSWLMGT